LKKLVGISLQEIQPDATAISRLLVAAARNLSDARVTEISFENRFDAAYKSVLQSANAALQASGYRTLTSKPGHHQTVLQLLVKTAGVDRETVIILDAKGKVCAMTMEHAAGRADVPHFSFEEIAA
jgi:uncharacterized protein YuzE